MVARGGVRCLALGAAVLLFPPPAGADVADVVLEDPKPDYPVITGYQPLSDVHQLGQLDLDLEAMESHLQLPEGPDFDQAKLIYTKGGHSGGYAEIDCEGLASALAEGDEVRQAGNPAAAGYAKVAAGKDAKRIQVMYTSTCKVRGSGKRDVSGCFTVHGGSLTVNGNDIGAPTVIQNKYRTLAGCSTMAPSRMAGQEYYSVYRAYYDYGDYAHRRVLDALGGVGSCSKCDSVARAEIAQKAPVYMNAWMYAIHQLESAVMRCSSGCKDCNRDSVHAWDAAVAVYSGSLEGTRGSGSGKLLYRLAATQCRHFGTCGSENKDVNIRIMEQFTLGKAMLSDGYCVDVVPIKRRIANLMSVPLVQGSLLYTHKVANSQGGSKERALGDIFSAAILPRLAVCSAAAAETVHDNLAYAAPKAVGSGFAAVKAAFESTYQCLGITCEDVGGLVISGSDTTYQADAAPCVTAKSGGAAPSLGSSHSGGGGGHGGGIGSSGGYGPGLSAVRPPTCSGGNKDLVIIIVVIAVPGSVAPVVAITCFLMARRYQKLLQEEQKGRSAVPATMLGGGENDA